MKGFVSPKTKESIYNFNIYSLLGLTVLRDNEILRNIKINIKSCGTTDAKWEKEGMFNLKQNQVYYSSFNLETKTSKYCTLKRITK